MMRDHDVNWKKLNNNVVQAMDNDVEYIVMGKGLGFQKKIGETVNKEKIEKTFVLENPETVAKWTRVYVDLPDGEMQVFLNIITFAEAVLQTKFDPSFLLLLQTIFIMLLNAVEKKYPYKTLCLGKLENFTLGSMKLENKPFVWLPMI